MTSLEIMKKVSSGELTEEQAAKLLAEQQSAAVAEALKRKIKLKVSAKRAIQIDGLRRMPITLYRGEWEAIDGIRDQIKAFIEANKGNLATKE